MKTTFKRRANPTFLDIENNPDNHQQLWMVAYKTPYEKASVLIGEDEIRSKLPAIIEDAESLAFHNAPFDAPILIEYGMDGVCDKTWHDTLLMGYIYNPNIEPVDVAKYSLEAWGKRLGLPKINLRDVLIEHKIISPNSRKLEEYRVPLYSEEGLRLMATYAVRDIDLTHKLWQHLYPQFDQHLWKLYKDVELPFQRMLIASEERGIRVDVEKLKEIEEEFGEDKHTFAEAIRYYCPIAPAHTRHYAKPRPDEEGQYQGGLLYVGRTEDAKGKLKYTYKVWDEFNPDAITHKIYALQSLYDWEPKQFSKKTGQPKLDSEILEELPNEYEIVQWFLEYSEVSKLHSTYCVGMLRKLNGGEVIYPTWNQCQTLTGRLSSSDPNLQNIPVRTERGKKLREVFIARDGYKLVGIDGSQVQLRILAWYLAKWCDDWSMWDAYQSGVADIHQHNAEIWGVERKVAKNITFAKIFQASNPKLARMIGTSLQETEKLVARVEKENPSLANLVKKVNRKGAKEGGVFRTLYGRRLCYPEINHRDKWKRLRAERQGFNAVIQGTEADIMKILAVHCRPAMQKYEAHLLLQVHDELLFEVPEDRAEAFKDAVNKVFDNEWVLKGLKFCGDAKVGNTWAEVH